MNAGINYSNLRSSLNFRWLEVRELLQLYWLYIQVGFWSALDTEVFQNQMLILRPIQGKLEKHFFKPVVIVMRSTTCWEHHNHKSTHSSAHSTPITKLGEVQVVTLFHITVMLHYGMCHSTFILLVKQIHFSISFPY